MGVYCILYSGGVFYVVDYVVYVFVELLGSFINFVLFVVGDGYVVVFGGKCLCYCVVDVFVCVGYEG